MTQNAKGSTSPSSSGSSPKPSNGTGLSSNPAVSPSGILPNGRLTPEELEEIHRGVVQLQQQGMLEPDTMTPERYAAENS